jgi:hypothetical protein
VPVNLVSYNFILSPRYDAELPVQVKKRLFTDELDSAYQNLRSVRNLVSVGAFPEDRLFRDAHRSILRSDPDIYEDIAQLPVWKLQVGLALFIESVTPIRVVLGYHGFSSETNFREAFLGYLSSRKGVRGYGPADFPSLIISGGYSLIKLNGMPYSVPVANTQAELYAAYGMPNLAEGAPISTDLWPLYASYADNPMLLLLELIWTRITHRKQISFPGFGPDLNLEILKLLLLAKAIEQDGKVGWYYEYFALPPDILDRLPAKANWQPIELDLGQATVLGVLILKENSGVITGVDKNSPDLLREFENLPFSLDDSIAYLRRVGLVSLEDQKLRVLTRECKIANLPDGRIVAGEDISGRFSNWLTKYEADFNAHKV